MNTSGVPNALFSALTHLPNFVRSAKADSLVQYTEPTRITPTTNIDRSLLAIQELPDILQVVASIYAGYYLMGVQLSINSIDGVSVLNLLDKVKPNRSPLGGAATTVSRLAGLAREDYTYRLPKEDMDLKPLVLPTLATESSENNATRRDTSTVGRASYDALSQDSNLAVGKTLEVIANVEGRQIAIPVNLRLNTFQFSPEQMVDIVANINPHMGAKEIKDLYMAGLIDLYDALTAKSAVDKWRKAAIKDKSGQIAGEQKRITGNKLAAAFTGELSVANISGIHVISANTARKIEQEIGGKLTNFNVREKMLKDTSVMLLVVVDPEWKRVTIYHHSIDGASSYGFTELKRGGKSGNHDIGAVLEAFRQGQAPAKFF